MNEGILEDFCELIVDCPHSTAPDEGSGYPLIRTPNVGRGRLILEGVHRVSQNTYNERNFRAIPQDDDLIFAREAPAGNVAVIKNGEKVCLGQRTVLIRPDKNKVDADYLAYYLLSPEQQYGLLGTANGATVAHVNIPVIRNLKICLPDLATQRRISSILSQYDSLIENCRCQIKLLEEAAQRTYREWFVEMRFPGHENVRMEDGLPEGWKREQLCFLGEFTRGKTITKTDTINGDVPVVAGGLEPAYYHNVSNTGSPVITVSGSGANAGFSRLYHEKIWASDCSYLDSGSTDNLYFVYCYLKDNKKSLDNLQKGAAQPHVYAKDINALHLILPTENLLEKFENQVKPYFELISKLTKTIEFAKQSRDLMLPRLMRGEEKI